MSITKKNVSRHELIGLRAEVLAANNVANTEIAGKVVDETQKSLVLKTQTDTKRIFKNGTVFRFTLPDLKTVVVTGDEIQGRSWERTGKIK